MNPRSRFIDDLRRKGISIYGRDGRLVLQAQPGLITQDLKDQLGRQKVRILKMLAQEQDSRISKETEVNNQTLSEIATLLARAYLRYQLVQKVPLEHTNDPIPAGLALSAHKSVDECAL